MRFFLTTTGFWLFRIALARRRAAWGNKHARLIFLTAEKYKQVKDKQHPDIHTDQRCAYSLINNEAHHAQVLPVVVLADDVPQAAEGGARVLVDGNLLIRGGRFALTCATRQHLLLYLHFSVFIQVCPYSSVHVI